MTTELTSRTDAVLMEKAVIEGDLTQLTARERVSYYGRVCESLGLNPYTKPFSYLKLNGRLVLYANRDATDQLRRLRNVSITLAPAQVVNDVYVVSATARTPDGRTDASTGAVSIKGLTGEFLANAMMKAETKAKRRVTLSICGLGWLDETEASSVPDAHVVDVNPDTGEIAPPQQTAEGKLAGTSLDVTVGQPPAEPPQAQSGQRPPPSQSQAAISEEAGKRPASLPMVREVERLIGLTKADVKALKTQYGVGNWADLTVSQATGLIDQLKGKKTT